MAGARPYLLTRATTTGPGAGKCGGRCWCGLWREGKPCIGAVVRPNPKGKRHKMQLVGSVRGGVRACLRGPSLIWIWMG